MTRSKKATRPHTAPAEVGAFMAALDHPLKADIEDIRRLILSVHPAIGEGIKWNAPSFRRTDWFATFHLRSRDSVQLVMHTGAKARDNGDFAIPDPNGLIKWLAPDRGLVTLGKGKALRANTRAFAAIVTAWLNHV